jgi:hypothetical protein
LPESETNWERDKRESKRDDIVSVPLLTSFSGQYLSKEVEDIGRDKWEREVDLEEHYGERPDGTFGNQYGATVERERGEEEKKEQGKKIWKERRQRRSEADEQEREIRSERQMRRQEIDTRASLFLRTFTSSLLPSARRAISSPNGSKQSRVSASPVSPHKYPSLLSS